MTVGELIAELQRFPDDMPVVREDHHNNRVERYHDVTTFNGLETREMVKRNPVLGGDYWLEAEDHRQGERRECVVISL